MLISSRTRISWSSLSIMNLWWSATRTRITLPGPVPAAAKSHWQRLRLGSGHDGHVVHRSGRGFLARAPGSCPPAEKIIFGPKLASSESIRLHEYCSLEPSSFRHLDHVLGHIHLPDRWYICLLSSYISQVRFVTPPLNCFYDDNEKSIVPPPSPRDTIAPRITGATRL
jgi:hypothetical protein